MANFSLHKHSNNHVWYFRSWEQAVNKVVWTTTKRVSSAVVITMSVTTGWVIPSTAIWSQSLDPHGHLWNHLPWKTRKCLNSSKHPLKTNAPVLPNTPNWNRYRMSLPQMQHLKSQSTHWRVTCDFQSNPADLHQDYALARFKDFNALSFLGSSVCKKMVYINIRGHECAECTAAVVCAYWYLCSSCR